MEILIKNWSLRQLVYFQVGSLTKHNMAVHGGDPGQFQSPNYRRRPGAHIKLSEEQTKALAETPVELAKTVSEKMLLSSAVEKVKAEKERARKALELEARREQGAVSATHNNDNDDNDDDKN